MNRSNDSKGKLSTTPSDYWIRKGSLVAFELYGIVVCGEVRREMGSTVEVDYDGRSFMVPIYNCELIAQSE